MFRVGARRRPLVRLCPSSSASSTVGRVSENLGNLMLTLVASSLTAASCPQDSGCYARVGDETKSVWTASRDWSHLHFRLPFPAVCCPAMASLERPKWLSKPVVSSRRRSKKGRAVDCSSLHGGRRFATTEACSTGTRRPPQRLLQVTDGQALPCWTAVPTCP